MSKRPELTDEQIEEIRRLRREEGHSAAVIGERLGVSSRTVQRLINKMGDAPNIVMGEDGKVRFDGIYLPADEEVLNRELEALRRWRQVAEQDEAAGKLPGPDPGQYYDPLVYIRRLVASPHKPDDLRLKGAEALLKEQRQRRRDAAEAKAQGSVDWATITATDIPSDAMGRLAGIGAAALVLDQAPFLAAPDTAPDVIEVWYLTGEHVEKDVALSILRELRPALEKAKQTAKASRMTTAVADPTPVWQDNPDVPVG